jgi:hypothetical protein
MQQVSPAPFKGIDGTLLESLNRYLKLCRGVPSFDRVVRGDRGSIVSCRDSLKGFSTTTAGFPKWSRIGHVIGLSGGIQNVKSKFLKSSRRPNHQRKLIADGNEVHHFTYRRSFLVTEPLSLTRHWSPLVCV